MLNRFQGYLEYQQRGALGPQFMATYNIHTRLLADYLRLEDQRPLANARADLDETVQVRPALKAVRIVGQH